jgi:Putative zinc-finger
MSGVGCAATREAAPELALGILDGAERAEVLLHVAGCPRCQRYLNELTGVADALSRLAPEAEPPVGFADRVQSRVRGSRRRAARRWAVTVAVTAAAAAILSVVVVRVVESGSSSRPAAAPAVRSVAMIGGSGLRVGHVSVVSTHPSSLVVSVDYAVPDGTYRLQLGQYAAARPIGSITIAGHRGQWVGVASVPREDGTVALVAPNGTVVCHAAVN